MYKHTFSIEALGVGRYGSMGYRRLLSEDSIAQYQLRTGLAVMRLYNYENKLNPDFSIPLMVEAVIGKGRNRLELSLGQIFTSYSRFEISEFKEGRVNELSLATGFGYRFVSSDRWEYRLSSYLIWDDYDEIHPWIGVSCGYRFGKL